MDKRSYEGRSIYSLDFLHTKMMGILKKEFPSFDIISNYTNPLDIEALCLMVALINSENSNAVFFSELIGRMGDTSPYEWIKSNSFMLSFAMSDSKRLVDDRTQLGVILNRFKALSQVLNDYGSVQGLFELYGKENPSKTIYSVLIGSIDNNRDYIEHIGINTALCWLTTTYVGAGFGVWKTIKQKDFYPPIDRSISLKINDEFNIKYNGRRRQEELKRILLHLDKECPYKYLPVLKLGRWNDIVKSMGYSYVGHLFSELKICSNSYKQYERKKRIQEAIFNVL